MTGRPIRLRYLLRERDTRGEVEEQVLSVYRDLGVIPKSDRTDNFNRTPDDLSNYKLVVSGDVVVNKMKAWQGSIAVSRHRGIVSGDYMVCRVVGEVDGGFLHHLLRSPALVATYAAKSRGIRPSQWRLYWPEFSDIRVHLPDIDEQRQIAAALDARTATIDALMSKREQLSRLLTERRQATINAALTPQGDWRVCRLKNLVDMNQMSLGENTPAEFEFRYVDIGSVGRGALLRKPPLVQFGEAPSRARRVVREHDTIISTVRTYLRAVWTVPALEERYVVSTGFAVLTPRPVVDPTFMSWLLQSDAVVEEVVRRSVGVSYPAINPSELGNIAVSVPPAAQQSAIAERLARHVAQLESLEAHHARLVHLLAERRRAVVSAVLAGTAA